MRNRLRTVAVIAGREFVIRDLDGHHWRFSSHPSRRQPRQMGSRNHKANPPQSQSESADCPRRHCQRLQHRTGQPCSA